MISDQQLLTSLAMSGNSESSRPLESVRHRAGLKRLLGAFREPRPLTILAGNSPIDTSQLISSFLHVVDSDVTVVQIDRTCCDALDGMRDVIQATGFDTPNMNLIELEIMFVKFLSLQRFKQQRTIFLIEETPENAFWVRGKVRDLVELEAAGNFGLMVILSRQSSSRHPIDIPALDSEMAATTIDLTKTVSIPFAPESPPSAAENGANMAEWNFSVDSDATVPLKKSSLHDVENLQDLTLEQPRLMIGRAEDNDLVIIKKNVSRHHAILVRHGAAAIVMDLNSTNGTYVNSRRIKDQVVVHHDIINIGAHCIRFIASDVPD